MLLLTWLLLLLLEVAAPLQQCIKRVCPPAATVLCCAVQARLPDNEPVHPALNHAEVVQHEETCTQGPPAAAATDKQTAHKLALSDWSRQEHICSIRWPV
jgi:hypothetical protein